MLVHLDSNGNFLRLSHGRRQPSRISCEDNSACGNLPGLVNGLGLGWSSITF